jgi:hypothetical protein
MKKFRLFFFILSGLVLTATLSFGQCTPDPNVTDPTGSGAMVPDSVDAQELQPTNVTITFIAPTQVVDPTLGTVTIHSIVLKSIMNIPSWMAYACNPSNCTFLAGIKQCALITGTPPAGTAGVVIDSCVIDVYIPPIIPGGAPIRVKTDYVYPTALKIYIKPFDYGVGEFESNDYRVLASKPNPFVNSTKVGIYTTTEQTVTLKVFDVVGKMVHSEVLNTNAGENYFNFDGSKLSNGMYVYSVINSDNQVISKKLIKTE